MPRDSRQPEYDPTQTLQRRLADLEDDTRSASRHGGSGKGSPGEEGPQGIPGTNGINGSDGGVDYTYNSSTTIANPGTGNWRKNNATFASITKLAISRKTESLVGWFNSMDVGDLLYFKGDSAESSMVFEIIGFPQYKEELWFEINVKPLGSNGSFASGQNTPLLSVPKGETGLQGPKGFTGEEGLQGKEGFPGAKGAPGSAVGLPYKFAGFSGETKPTAEFFAINAFKIKEATKIFANAATVGGNVAAYLKTWDDSTSTVKGYIYVEQAGEPNLFGIYQVVGLEEKEAGAWFTFTVTNIAGTSELTFGTGAEVRMQFLRTGDKGGTGEKGSTGEKGETGAPGAGGAQDWKESCRAATTANITISTALNNADVLDGVTLATGDRVLVKDQTTKSENGIWVVGVTPARATDADTAGELSGGTTVYVEQGTRNSLRHFKITTVGSITPGTTAHEWTGLTPKDFGLVAALPTTEAVIGDRCYYKAVSGEMLWQFVYDGEGTYPWKFVGGNPLFHEIEAEQVTKETTFANLTTEGPFLTIPLKGFYDVTMKALMTNTTANSHSRMSYSIGGTAAATVDMMDALDAGNGFTVANNVRTRRKEFTAAATKLVAKYAQAGVAGEAKFAARVIEAVPIRCA